MDPGKFLFVLLLLFVALPALADSNVGIKSFYIGAGGGQSEADDFCAGVGDCDDSDTAWKLFGGYRFNPFIAIEAGYVDFGEYTANDFLLGFPFTAEAEVTGITAHVVVSAPVHERVSLFARLGTIYADTDVSGTAAGLSVDADDQSFSIASGLGIEFNIVEQFALRAEYELFSEVGDNDETGEDDISLFSASALFRF